ncbi:ras-related protein Rab5-like isoform X1 [Petromyzon marinus]|uniref:Ras-related protein Rab5-like isoform X1 n=1 Tax=Petromyzon marinus TaxID=7757 RepID=A0AAJ7WRP9_PETMA|nr:ras-related protein Rab5-like isoform X1 [Petromyzon marinus]
MSARSPIDHGLRVKLVLIGESNVGKTSLLRRLARNQFIPNEVATVGVAFQSYVVHLEEAPVRLEIWDTAGQERHRMLTPIFFRNAEAAVLTYDISSQESFNKLQFWISELKEKSHPNVVMALAGSKCDLEVSRQVQHEEGARFAREHGMIFMETSAQAAMNVVELFHAIAERVSKNHQLNTRGDLKKKRSKSITLQPPIQAERKCYHL